MNNKGRLIFFFLRIYVTSLATCSDEITELPIFTKNVTLVHLMSGFLR